MTKTNEYGDFEVEGSLDIKNAKVKITLYVDGDVLEKVRSLAKKEQTKYQTLINRILRKTVLNENLLEDRIRVLEEWVVRVEKNNKVA